MTLATVWLAVWLIAAVQVPLVLILTRGPSVEETAVARALWLRLMAPRHAFVTTRRS